MRHFALLPMSKMNCEVQTCRKVAEEAGQSFMEEVGLELKRLVALGSCDHKGEQVMGNSIRWACIYVPAVGKMAQSEGKVCRKKQRDRGDESNMDQFDGQDVKLHLTMI